MELHGNEEARDARNFGPVVPGWSVGGVTDRRHQDKRPSLLPPSHLLCNRSCLLHTRSVVIELEVRSVPPLPLITPLQASVELVGTRSRSLHTKSLQHGSPTPVVQREGSSPTQPWKGSCWGSSCPLTRGFASSKLLPIPPPYPSESAYRILLGPGPDPRRGTPDGRTDGFDSPGPLPCAQT